MNCLVNWRVGVVLWGMLVNGIFIDIVEVTGRGGTDRLFGVHEYR